MSPADDLPPGARGLLKIVLFGLAGLLRIFDAIVLLFRPRLLKPYFALMRSRFAHSPYRWPDDFETTLARKKTGQALRELMYGDTPVSIAVYLLGQSGARSPGRLLDVGAGRGHVLLAGAWWGLEARGVELVRTHVMQAAPVLAPLGVHLESGGAGAEPLDLDGVTHVFLAWTGFEADIRSRIEADLIRLEPGSRVIALTHPLRGSGFRGIRQGAVPLPWGMGAYEIFERIAK